MIYDPTLALDLGKLTGGLSSVKEAFFPYWVQTKEDGVRVLLTKHGAYSRTKKLIMNAEVQRIVCKLLAGRDNVLDAEFTVRTGRNHAASIINSVDGEVPYHARFVVFDDQLYHDKLYNVRINRVLDLIEEIDNDCLEFVHQHGLLSYELRSEFHERFSSELEWMHRTQEGVILKSSCPYLTKRSTKTQPALLREVYRFEETFQIVDFVEEMENTNPITYEMGRAVRSSHRAGMVPKNTLGALVVTKYNELGTFNVSSGLDRLARDTIWQQRDKFKGRLVDIQYKKPVLNAPQHPVFLRFNNGEVV